jgi:2-oxoglutarate ferredoxin oxidoreductase subunit beta
VEDKKTRIEASLKLADGEPLVFGPPGRRCGIRIENGIPSVVQLAEGRSPLEAGVAIHYERHESPAYAFALASLQRPTFPIPIGVFRAVEKPTYEALLEEQVTSAIARRGPGDIATLLDSGDTWTVEG